VALWSQRENFDYCPRNEGCALENVLSIRRECRKWKEKSYGRCAVNLQPADTMEFRLPSGTVDANRVIAYIQFVDCMLNIEQDTHIEHLVELAERKGYTELLETLQEFV
jgi:hypothetical protein